MGRHKRATPYKPDEIADAEAIVAFYEKRLDEALERLGALIEASETKRPRPRAGG